MWKLKTDSSIEKEYLKQFEDKLVDRIINGVGKNKLSKDIKKILIPDYTAKKPVKLDIVEKLLTAKPKEALDLNNDLMRQIFTDYDVNDLDTLKPHKIKLKRIEKVINYDGVISKNKEKSYWLAHRVGHNTCTYCNRQYTITISCDDKALYITRPQFDHWFPKELFPLLSLNLYNMIPSCSICNSTTKGREVFSFDTHVHPYLQTENEPNFKFLPKISTEAGRDWTVILSRDIDSKEDNTIKAFKLDDIYDAHGDLEVKDLMNLATGYTHNYLRDLFNNVLKDYSTKGYTFEDVYRMVFGVESSTEHTLDRPLSKLKRDLLKYLNVIP
jgi:hypothetical protein